MVLNKRNLTCFFSSLLLFFPLFADERGTSRPLNSRCLSCHSIESTCNKKYRINENNFYTSVHSNLKCTDCHQVTLRDDREAIPHKKDIPDVNCTAKCHKEDSQLKPRSSPRYYPDSVHGKAYVERGVQDAAKCWDCHTKHNIKKTSNLESTVNRKNIPVTCSVCHEDINVIVKYNIHCEKPYQEYMKSVHGKALFKDGLLLFAAVCTDCHGVHNIKGIGEPYLMAKKPETCGKCHILIYNEYKESIHGNEALKGNIDVPLCIDCHGEHDVTSPLDEDALTYPTNISDTCSTCHARPEIMQKYDIPEDRVESFIQSLHGIAIGYGYKAVANCTSCHGVHDIKPAKDPSSKVNPSNLAKTCGQVSCHPGMPEKIAMAKIHTDISQKKSGAPYYVQKIFLWIIFVAAIITIIWFVPGFIRKIKLLKKK